MKALDDMQNLIDADVDLADGEGFQIKCPLCCQDATDVALLPQLLYKNAAEFAQFARFCQKEERAQREVDHYCTLARRELAKIPIGGYWNEGQLEQPLIRQLMAELSGLEGDYAGAAAQGLATMRSIGAGASREMAVGDKLTQLECSALVVKSLVSLGQCAQALPTCRNTPTSTSPTSTSKSIHKLTSKSAPDSQSSSGSTTTTCRAVCTRRASTTGPSQRPRWRSR